MLKNIKLVLCLLLISCSTVRAGPMNWTDAEKYISIQQKQFCDLTDSYVMDLNNAINSKNEIKINKVKKKDKKILMH
jgi:hypothetical protein